jgi:tetratricopeptide (TPR) repeat protein
VLFRSAVGELDRVRDAHLAYFAQIADRRWVDLLVGDNPEWRETVVVEARNLHAALEWSFDQRQGEHALAILSGIFPSAVHAARMKRWLEDALDLPAERATLRRLDALIGLSDVAMLQDDRETRERASTQVLELARELEEPHRVAMALTALSDVALERGDSDTARRLIYEAIEIRRAQENAPGGLARSLVSLANIEFVEQKYDRAQQLLEEALALVRSAHPRSVHIGEYLVHVGHIALRRRAADAAVVAFAEALRRGHELGEAWTVAESLEGIAALRAVSGEAEVAARIAGAAAGLRERAGVTARLVTGADDPVGDPADPFWTAGRAMSTDAAVEYALASVDSPA